MFKYSELDINAVKPIVGSKNLERCKEILRLLKVANVPLLFTGSSGTGKTHTSKRIAVQYAKKNEVPAYFVPLSPDQTKTNIILGLRLINGSLQVQNGVVAECMEKGGIIVVDEATHATQSLLLMFNSLMDKEAITSIGDKFIKAKDTFRIIFCCNDSNYSGNIKLPQSFCNRLIAFNFEYPTLEEEMEISKHMLQTDNIEFDEKILMYFVKMMREIRNTEIPLSVRNVYSACLLLSLNRISEGAIEITGNMEAKFRKILMLLEDKKDTDITKGDILRSEGLIQKIHKIGLDKINEAIKQSYMYYVDFDCSVYAQQEYKNKLEGHLL